MDWEVQQLGVHTCSPCAMGGKCKGDGLAQGRGACWQHATRARAEASSGAPAGHPLGATGPGHGQADGPMVAPNAKDAILCDTDISFTLLHCLTHTAATAIKIARHRDCKYPSKGEGDRTTKPIRTSATDRSGKHKLSDPQRYRALRVLASRWTGPARCSSQSWHPNPPAASTKYPRTPNPPTSSASRPGGTRWWSPTTKVGSTCDLQCLGSFCVTITSFASCGVAISGAPKATKLRTPCATCSFVVYNLQPACKVHPASSPLPPPAVWGGQLCSWQPAICINECAASCTAAAATSVRTPVLPKWDRLHLWTAVVGGPNATKESMQNKE